MLAKELLQKLDLGSSVAEHDDLLENYFVETETFRALIKDKADIVAGDKGTGKSALYRILSKRYSRIDELKDVEVVSAFNITGTPVFQSLTESAPLSESEYIRLWKTYFFALAGNWMLDLLDEYEYSDELKSINTVLEDNKLRTPNDTPRGVFARITEALRRSLKLKSAKGRLTVFPVEVEGSVELFSDKPTPDGMPLIDHELRKLSTVLRQQEIVIWLAIDRLDEAFQGRPAIETPALRALLRTYLEMQEFDNLKLKIFLRRDLFGRIIQGGFVNLTHINARKVEIIWDSDDLYSLLEKRIAENQEFVNLMGMYELPFRKQFELLFPEQVDFGERRSKTWKWILTRIGDGNVTPPRNLIDFILKARESQLRAEDRHPRVYSNLIPLFTSESLKLGLEELSRQRVQDTLFAEAGDYSSVIQSFRGGKAEHNAASLQELLGEDSIETTSYLESIGFLVKKGASHKIPPLYRGGLDVTQGKAFIPRE